MAKQRPWVGGSGWRLCLGRGWGTEVGCASQMGTPPVLSTGTGRSLGEHGTLLFLLSGIRSKNMVGARRQKVLVFSGEGRREKDKKLQG